MPPRRHDVLALPCFATQSAAFKERFMRYTISTLAALIAFGLSGAAQAAPNHSDPISLRDAVMLPAPDL
jgi:hypothetical protein